MRTLCRPVFLMAVFLAVPGLGADQLPPDTVKKITSILLEARSHNLQKEYAKSTEAYEKALALLPAVREGQLEASRAKIHLEIGSNHALLGKKKEAIDAIGRAVSHGYWDHAFLTQDPTFKELRSEKDFQVHTEKARLSFSRMAAGLVDVRSGKKIEAADLEGKVIIVDIWGTWCPPCRREIPHFIQLQEKYGSRGLQIVGLTWERTPPEEPERKKVIAFGKENQVNYPLVMLEEDLYSLLSALYGVRSFPTTFFFGRDGSMKQRYTGLQSFEVLQDKAVELLEEPRPTTAAPAEAPKK